MKRIFIEFLVLIGIGGLLWAAIALFIRLPERPVLLSVEKEESIGKAYKEMILNMMTFKEVSDKRIDSMLAATADSLASFQENPRFRYSISLAESELVNAFALPGGYMIVTTALVEFCETPEEFIAVLSHEIGHIEKRHVISRLIRELGLNLITSNDPYVTGEVARILLSSGYNRKQEEEADRFACELLLQAGLEPRSLASLFRRLKEENKSEMYEHFEIVSSHPNLEKRIRTVLSFPLPEGFQSRDSWLDWEEFTGIVKRISED
jgi:beta-barrel assembly-enhancing protease